MIQLGLLDKMKLIQYKDLKIVAISDTHGYHKLLSVPECDLLIHAGDFSENVGSQSEAHRFMWWMAEQPALHKIVVPGNHDCQIEKSTSYYQMIFQQEAIELLIDDVTEVMGIRIFGSPWTNEFMNWSFMKSEKNLAKMYKKFPDNGSNIDILITHGPSYGVLDGWDGHNCGSKALSKYIYKLLPDIHIHGHIHESTGSTLLYSGEHPTMVHNVSVAHDILEMLNRI